MIGGAELISHRFGSLVVVELLEGTKSGRLWLCRCDCGGEAKKITSQLRSHPAIGCRRCETERRAAIHTRHGDARGEGNGGKQRLYTCWKGMRKRCHTPSDTVYKYYGGKGIGICEEWDNYDVFRWWAILHGYRDDLVLDRLDPEADYCPENCEWITKSENSRRMMAYHRRNGTGPYRRRRA